MAYRLVHRANSLLTWKRARFWAGALCVLYVTAYVWVLVNGRPPLNSSGEPIGGDYIAFHTAGRLVLSGEAAHVYDRSRIAATEDALLQAQVSAATEDALLQGQVPGFYDAFRNPPFVALIFAPLALLDLLPGFVAWTLLSLACLGVATWLLLEEVPQLQPRWRGLLLLVFAFPPVYFGLVDGENATVSLLLYVLIHRSLSREQAGRAGVYAALGLFKPQLFLVFPLVLVAQRSGRALLGYGLTAVGLAVVSLLVVGPDGMQAWFRILLEPEASNAAATAWRMASLKSAFDTLLPGQFSLALGLYVATSLLLLSGLFARWAKRRRTDSPQRLWILTSLVAVLVDPHLVDYDLSVLIPAGVLACCMVPELRSPIVPLFVLTLLRIQLPIGRGALQVTTLCLCWLTFLAWRHAPPQRVRTGRHLRDASGITEIDVHRLG